MSFSKWIRGDTSPVRESSAVDVGDTRYSFSRESSVRQLRELISTGGPHWLMEGFVWSSSPQGWAYWSARYEGDALLSEEDYDFIRALADHFESGGGRRFAG